jgi:hypothetical protein
MAGVCERIKNERKTREREEGGTHLFLKLAELLVLPLSIFVYLLLGFATGVLDALCSVCGTFPRINISFAYLFLSIESPGRESAGLKLGRKRPRGKR